jgi:AcrR family transcriptional regulator
VGRWEPNARGRLEVAALELFGERGFDHTTAAEIAARAGVTERTFFRHFADKREVLFGATTPLMELLARRVAEAPAPTAPIGAVADALAAVGELLQDRDDLARQRQAVIEANPELREREGAKLATMAETLATALSDRGVPAATAQLAAQAGIAAFRVAYQTWVTDTGGTTLAHVIRESFVELRAVTAGE